MLPSKVFWQISKGLWLCIFAANKENQRRDRSNINGPSCPDKCKWVWLSISCFCSASGASSSCSQIRQAPEELVKDQGQQPGRKQQAFLEPITASQPCAATSQIWDKPQRCWQPCSGWTCFWCVQQWAIVVFLTPLYLLAHQQLHR